VGYGWHVKWVGGAFLRFDWLVAVVLALCALERRRIAIAGLLLGYAVLVRLFPAAFLMGPAVLVLRGLLRRELPPWLPRLAAGFGLALGLGLLAGCATGRGFAAWPEFVHKIRAHGETWGRNHVGLHNAILFAPELAHPRASLAADSALANMNQEEVESRRLRFRPALIFGSAVLLLLVAAAQWRASLSGAAALGLVAVYALFPLSCYYWMMLAILPLRRGSGAAVAVVALSALIFAVADRQSGLDRLAPYVLMSAGLLPILVCWTLPVLLRGSERPDVEPAAQPSRS
jgi:hypothetical protein